MGKAIREFRRGAYGFKFGIFGFGRHGQGIGTVRQAVHDGDTVEVRNDGDFGVRMLGIDTPEVSFALPGASFVPIADARWAAFLDDPFDKRWDGTRALKLSRALKKHLRSRVGADCAANHARHAEAAQRALEAAVQADLEALGRTNESFALFLAFAYEIMDGYGRLLAYVNADAPPAQRPARSYNERQLAAGQAVPYMIWPNVNPYRKQSALPDAVPAPGGAADEAGSERSLRDARGAVRAAREGALGIFDRADPLRLDPSELRFLAQRRAPTRWLVDLSRNDSTLVPPQEYFLVAPEDRLFVPDHFVPLFQKRGWKKG